VAINPERWVTSADYPEGVVRRIAQGVVAIAFEIGADSRARECRVTARSGHVMLDEIPCPLVTRRARFHPLRGSDRRAIRSHGVMHFSFRTSP